MLTLALDEAGQARFEALRRQWFPPERNQIPAHVTLFHTLPEAETTDKVLRDAAGSVRAFSMSVGGLRSTGRGVAYFLESSAAVALQRRLRESFGEQVTAQDRQGFRPHVVVQNKVETAVARETLAVLQAGFEAWDCRAVGLDLWRYMGGPWEHLNRFVFEDAASD